jgi:hypothetical protein
LDNTPKAQETKIKRENWDYIKPKKHLFTKKEIHNRVQEQPENRDICLQSIHLTRYLLISTICKIIPNT